jgi:hypothetical protein
MEEETAHEALAPVGQREALASLFADSRVNYPYYRYTGANQLWILPRIGMVPFHSGTRLDSPFRQFAGCSFKTRNGQHLSGE